MRYYREHNAREMARKQTIPSDPVVSSIKPNLLDRSIHSDEDEA